MSNTEYPSQSSPSIGKVILALSKARNTFKPILKNSDNPFFKSKYADLTQCLDSVNESLSANELVVVQTLMVSGSVTYLVSTLGHSSGEFLSSNFPLPDGLKTSQQQGSAITYARRYALCALLGLAPQGEDDDGNAASQTLPVKTYVPVKSPSEPSEMDALRLAITSMVKEKDVSRSYISELIFKKYGVKLMNQLNLSELKDLLETVRAI